MAGKFLEVAVILTAMDRMSGVINSATGKSAAGFNALANSKERADKMLSEGTALAAGAAAGITALTHFANKYGDIQEAQLDLRAAMMGPGGILDEKLMDRINRFSVAMSKKYAGSQMDYIDMIRIMKQNRLNPEDMLGGTGEAVAKLAELFKMQPGAIGLFASRMRNDMKVPVKDMEQMADLMARLNGAGVGTNGAETVEKLTELFSKAGLGATNLRLFGLQNAKDMGSLGGMFLSKGLDAASVGTTFRRIFDNVADPKKLAKMNAEAAIFGKHLEFYDKAGNFKGIPNMIAQLATLQKLTTVQRAAILDPFGSKQGLGGDVMKQLASFGLRDFEEYQGRLEHQGTLAQKVSEIQKGLNQQERIASSNIDNLSGAIGKSYNPAVTGMVKLTGKLADILATSIGNHPYISGIVAGLVGIASVGMAVGAAFKFMGAAWGYSGMAKITGMLADLAAPALVARFGVLGVTIPEVFSAIGLAAAGAAAEIAAVVGVLAVLISYFHEVEKGNRMLPKYNPNEKYNLKTEGGKISAFANKTEESDYQAWWLRHAKSGGDRSHLERADFLKSSDRPNVSYSPTYNISGITDPAAFRKLLNEHSDAVKKIIFTGHNASRRAAY